MNNTNINTNQQIGAMISRISLGTILLAHGLLKVMVFGVEGTVGYFASLGLPSFIAYLTIFGEIAGGIALILGLYTRLAAALSVPILIGATWAQLGNGWLFSNANGGWEFLLLLVALSVSVAFQGPGAFAIKHVPLLDPIIPAPLRS